MPSKTKASPAISDSYLNLVKTFPLTSIKSDTDLEAAHNVINRLLARAELDHGEETYLDAISDLVVAYEDVRYPIEPVSDADMLRHLMEAKGVTQSQLSKEANVAKSTVSEVLSGKKRFSRKMIVKLANYFNVHVNVLTGNLSIDQHSSD